MSRSGRPKANVARHLLDGSMKMKRRFLLALIFVVISPLARAGGISFVGALDHGNPNDVFLASFSLAAAGTVTIRTWSFGGTVDAPGGVNLSGRVITAGGFDPYVSIFAGTGPSATFLASNDDGLCPPGHAAPVCADSTLVSGLLATGTYTLALTLPFNYSFAENTGSGSLGDGFIALDSSFNDGACATICSNAYAVDISSAALVPEPSSSLLLSAGGLMLYLFVRRRSRLDRAQRR